MRIAIIRNPPDLSDYVAEILRTWGLVLFDPVAPDAVDRLDPAVAPVLICPASDRLAPFAPALRSYTERGGSLFCFLPTGELAAMAGLADLGEKTLPLRLRVTDEPAPGLAGELIPIVGAARSYRKVADEAWITAYLTRPVDCQTETPGIVTRPLGHGRVTAFAFDLPLCLRLLRQGDPARAEWFPEGITPGVRHAKTTHMAAEVGPGCDGWIPFADLLGRYFAGLVRQRIPVPMPLLGHLPGEAPALVLYSGDEDTADPAWIEDEFAAVTAAGGRMNLYVVPTSTHSTPASIRLQLPHHDFGPHPNLRDFDGRPVAERLAEYERQVRILQDQFGVRTLTTRHHCLAWVGYTDVVEVQERLGIRMDANFIGGPACFRHMETGPYFGFGAAMPMRFCRLDGRLLEVFQQHTHVEDDMWFGAQILYSLKLSPAVYRTVWDRMLDDAIRRFHTPLGLNIHPSNWVKFSGRQGRDTLSAAVKRGIPIWSFDQWCEFWQARDGWRIAQSDWNGAAFTARLEGRKAHPELRVWMPMRHGNVSLTELRVDGRILPLTTVVRYDEPFALAPLDGPGLSVELRAQYQ